MKLIKIEIEGFKSFAEPVSIKFDGSIVGIIGPNGSGKSNINDAIKWVLGEKSVKQLRGQNMDDVIFAGSKTVMPVNKAMVKLTFLDETREDSAQIFTISRVIKRGQGTNEYFYNDQLVRYKDIRNLAIQAGISKSSLAIISQGTISEIAESSPEQRKQVIEEVAGTAKYKIDKTEALTKLDQTLIAIEKIEIRTKELEKQVKQLEKQAENAKIYLEKSKQLESVEVGLIVSDIKKYQTELDQVQEKLNDLKFQEPKFISEIEANEKIIITNTQKRSEIEAEINTKNREIHRLKEQINTLNLAYAKATQLQEMILSSEISVNFEQKMAALRQKYSLISAQKDNFAKLISQNKLKKLEIEEKLNTFRTQKGEIERNLYSLNSEKIISQTRISELKKSLESMSFLPKGTKIIIENSFLFPGYCGLVSDLIKIFPKYTGAIEAALGPTLKQIVVDQPETAVSAINFLKKNYAGSATFIPLSTLKPRFIPDLYLEHLNSQKGFINLASNLVDFEKKYKILADFLLGGIIVADTIDSANQIANFLNHKNMIVTLDGDVIRTSGIISGGHKIKNDSSFSIQYKIDELTNNLNFFEEKIQEFKVKSNEFEQLITRESVFLQQININLNDLEQKFSNSENELIEIKAQNEGLEESLNQKDDLNLSLNRTLKEKIELENVVLELENQCKILKTEKKQLDNQISELTVLVQELNQKQRKINADLNQNQNYKDKYEFLITNLRNNLSQKYSLTFEGAAQKYELEIQEKDAREFVNSLNLEIKALGNVNLDAINDFETTSQRLEKLKKSQNELETARSKILEVISDLDKIIIGKTQEIVDLVNSEFNLVFQNMFGGGSAKIYFSDKNDILNSGIEISAQPPGKTIKNIRLFSGGEKAIIAISLLFSIIKARPIPLCILDEVEAALDESNVIRYVEFLKQLKQKTQFLIITHRHGTMSRVDQLLGITMQKRGVSSIFSVELSKAKDLLKEQLQ
ncbi:chromosome partitioning protein Smc [Mesomycoplasma hyopneumoniae]|uniref:AAA family ATPase n=1 Tax=Mesomycoplasma hyopneumoniae TaxID=2099 RepID=UPI0011B47D25|nr:AAA family ATPase [Mesomycoplasma hyopneumoniae]MXR10960.1 chromosome segregation protein SMC [Mesomycoplasma hyopneumoniae]MXR34612.1 chromosome segregation protein SMC [Mesomycoplasma hyopneumoniae]MXR63789.1 chromosome segregation protein SMC [Mesomycoplasma hyopneumoniae]QEA02862.1 chromosome partitioning protein Smc [Mesomycoplasma hyopneumoniae]